MFCSPLLMISCLSTCNTVTSLCVHARLASAMRTKPVRCHACSIGSGIHCTHNNNSRHTQQQQQAQTHDGHLQSHQDNKLCESSGSDIQYLEIFDDLLKLPINDLACINVTMQHFQLLTGQPVWSPLGVIEAVCKFGLCTNIMLIVATSFCERIACACNKLSTCDTHMLQKPTAWKIKISQSVQHRTKICTFQLKH